MFFYITRNLSKLGCFSLCLLSNLYSVNNPLANDVNAINNGVQNLNLNPNQHPNQHPNLPNNNLNQQINDYENLIAAKKEEVAEQKGNPNSAKPYNKAARELKRLERQLQLGQNAANLPRANLFG